MAVILTTHDWPLEVFICDCGELDHSISFLFFPPTSKDPDDTIYVSMGMHPWRGFFRRALVALKFLFNIEPKGGISDTMSFRHTDMDRLLAFLKLQVGEAINFNILKEEYLALIATPYEMRFCSKVETFEDGDLLPEFFVEVFFERNRSCLRRLWWGIKYTLGCGKWQGRSVEFYLQKADSKKLKALASGFKQLCLS